jgi:hypothetical protein
MAAAAVPSSTTTAFLFDFLEHFRVHCSGPIGMSGKPPAQGNVAPAMVWPIGRRRVRLARPLGEFPSTIAGVGDRQSLDLIAFLEGLLGLSPEK